jgi:hypothetical protein
MAITSKQSRQRLDRCTKLQAIRMMHDLRRDVDEFCKIKGFAGFNVDNSGYFVKGICLRKSG